MQRSCRAVALLVALLACSSGQAPPKPATPPALPPPTAGGPTSGAGKTAWFGDLRIHSRWSFDAYSMQVRVGPEDAYRYARGQAIDHVSGDKIPPL